MHHQHQARQNGVNAIDKLSSSHKPFKQSVTLIISLSGLQLRKEIRTQESPAIHHLRLPNWQDSLLLQWSLKEAGVEELFTFYFNFWHNSKLSDYELNRDICLVLPETSRVLVYKAIGCIYTRAHTHAIESGASSFPLLSCAPPNDWFLAPQE